ncbi:MAG: hypothetical protein INR64_00980 [Caulobacteraceae bacterium]|nr:hypothetical protein [Caulobacter sp.]
MFSCNNLIDEVCELAALLSSQLEREAREAQEPVKHQIASGLEVLNSYIDKLGSARERASQADILKAVNSFTGVSKGLLEQGWLGSNSIARETAWSVTKSAIRASACLREGGM